MALVLVLSADLMFGSRIQAQLQGAGHEVVLVPDAQRLGERLAQFPRVLIADLTDERLDGVATVQALAAQGALAQVRTLAFYSHVEADTRERALQAGFDLVVPRSRMAREGAQLVASLL